MRFPTDDNNFKLSSWFNSIFLALALWTSMAGSVPTRQNSFGSRSASRDDILAIMNGVGGSAFKTEEANNLPESASQFVISESEDHPGISIFSYDVGEEDYDLADKYARLVESKLPSNPSPLHWTLCSTQNNIKNPMCLLTAQKQAVLI